MRHAVRIDNPIRTGAHAHPHGTTLPSRPMDSAPPTLSKDADFLDLVAALKAHISFALDE